MTSVRSPSSALGAQQAHEYPPAVDILKNWETQSACKLLVEITKARYLQERKTLDLYEHDENRKVVTREVNGPEYWLYQLLLLVMYYVYGMFRFAQYKLNDSLSRKRELVQKLSFRKQDSPISIRNYTRCLSKTPQRVAFILEKRDSNAGVRKFIEEICDVIYWSVAAGIKDISIYEYYGFLNLLSDQLKDRIETRLAHILGVKAKSKFTILMPGSDYQTLKQQAIARDHTVITLLSSVNGRPAILDLTRHIQYGTFQPNIDKCDADEHNYNMNSKGTSIVEKDYSEVPETPDTEGGIIGQVTKTIESMMGREPDLLVCFDPHLDLQSFPPWHIRLTEFYWKRDNRKVDLDVFLEALTEYSNCKVNVGK